MSDTLDVRILDKRGRALVKEIAKIVNDPKSYIFTPVPSKIKMNELQYASLLSEPELRDMVKYSQFEDRIKPSKRKLFYTNKYVLEVEVVEK
jgi:hypothetical protein